MTPATREEARRGTLPDGADSPQELRDRRLVRLAGRRVTDIKGVGAKSAQALSELGIETVLDLVTYYPRRYIDRTNARRIDELADGDQAVVLATVARVETRRTRNRRSLVAAEISDGPGMLNVSFFNQPWRARQLAQGMEVVVAGKVTTYRGRMQMTNPTVDIVGKPGHRRTGRLVPVYRQSEKAGLSSWDLEPWIDEALRRAGEFDDPIPPEWRHEFDLIERGAAFHAVHFPVDHTSRRAARRRLVFDEMLRLQLVLVRRKDELERSEHGIAHRVDAAPSLVEELTGTLPFPLTRAQQRAIAEIAADMGSARPMHRLLQGDVGSGKTVVAVAALLIAGQGRHQGAVMVPTEVLAEQHFASMRRLVAPITVPDEATLSGSRPFRVELLTGSVPAARRTRILRGLASGEVDGVVGTHALLSEGVDFRSLGVVIVDEQHRFGVEQRAKLRSKRGDGQVPDLLVMTATPIPRSVTMTVFGDLDTTVIDEMPPGRSPVETAWLSGQEDAAFAKVREEVEAGRQAYVVCPLVGESDAVAARAATEEYYRLGEGPLSGIALGLVHGQLAARDKEASMEAFRTGRTSVLVSTTVIEVGVDVPNATVMVIEDAWRFGIAQLHQLRGRVGRGGHPSWCFLLGDPPAGAGDATMLGDDSTSAARARLEALCASTDGFALAEEDLRIRGEGAVTGASQSGRSSLKLGSVLNDRDLVECARTVAQRLVASGWAGDDPAGLGEEIAVLIDESEAGFLTKG